MLDSVIPILQQARTVYIAIHVSPDGDAIGSALGLAFALTALGKKCTVACANPAPASVKFLPGSNKIVHTSPTTQDVIVCLDTGDISRLGKIFTPESFGDRTVINIDHHLTNTRYGTINHIDAQAAAVGEMVYLLVQALGVPLNPKIATCLLTAMVTDTIGFRTNNTTPRTLHAAAALMEAGAPLSDIVQQSFESRPLPVLRVWGVVLSNFHLSGGIAWATIPKAVLSEFGVKEDDIKGLVNVMRGTQGAVAAALLMESQDGNIKVEFRSTGQINVADVAIALGGGGHRASVRLYTSRPSGRCRAAHAG